MVPWKHSDSVDRELVDLAQKGNGDALIDLIIRYIPFVKYSTRQFFATGLDSEDIVQEGMIGLYKAIQSYRSEEESSFLSYASLLIKRQAISAVKRAMSRRHEPLNLSVPMSDEADMTAGAEYDPESVVVGREQVEVISKTISERLSKFERAVLTRYMEGKSYAKIADELGCGEKSVDNALWRVKKKLMLRS